MIMLTKFGASACSLYTDLPPESLETVIRSSIKKIGENRKCRSGARLVRNLMIAKVVRKAKLLMLTAHRQTTEQSTKECKQAPITCDKETKDTLSAESESKTSHLISCQTFPQEVSSVDEVTSSSAVNQISPSDSSTVLSSDSPVSKRRHRSNDSDTSNIDSCIPSSGNEIVSLIPPSSKLPRLEFLDLSSKSLQPMEVDSDIENCEPKSPTNVDHLPCSKDTLTFPCKMECDTQSYLTMNSCTIISSNTQPTPLYCLSFNKTDFSLNNSPSHFERSMVQATS